MTAPVSPARDGGASGRHILITDFDLFHSAGGGQTVYRRMIALRPRDRFYYLLERESPAAPRPANTVGIPFRPKNWPVADRHGLGAHLIQTYSYTRNLANSVARQFPDQAFDVVDVPDYTQHGVFIRTALAAEGLRCGRVVLALHGTLSSAFAGGWPAPDDNTALLDQLRRGEDLQFRAADARYAISAAYASEWQQKFPLAVNLADPLSVMPDAAPLPAVARDGPPDLAFVGRREKWKGPDIFLDLAWCVDRALYRRLIVAGPDGLNHLGIGSAGFLAEAARRRGLRPEMVGGLPVEAVRHLLAERTVLLLPSRHDTFNLVALEALAHGCPALISSRAGVAAWLLKTLPELAWLVVDIGCARTAAAAAADLLRNYESRRDEVVAAMRGVAAPGPEAFDEIYRLAPAGDSAARAELTDLAAAAAASLRSGERAGFGYALRYPGLPARRVFRLVEPLLPQALAVQLRRRLSGSLRRLRRLRRAGLHGVARETIKTRSPGHRPVAARDQADRRQPGGALAPYAGNDLAALSGRVADHLVDRVPLFRTMARLERQAGRDLIAATYGLRIMRWLGGDGFGDLPFVSATLRAHGFAHEADTAEAMFGRGDDTEARCLELMRDAYRRNRHNSDPPLAVDDRRGDVARRVCVIVSLYNAADKLPTLLACLAQQSLALRGELEVVLVDSNSPADERAAMEGFLARQPLPVAYARSAERETIQQAWNRGIKLARAPYLAFLGADEGLHPDALRQLADALDADPRADWAMADSLVTDVDAAGVYAGDVMAYDRTGYRQDLVYLETCYLSWVGGLYRRSIHDRFGYYDESFRAAGDTEFKNRIMPHIRSVHVPRMLGVFNNYPEARTTASPTRRDRGSARLVPVAHAGRHALRFCRAAGGGRGGAVAHGAELPEVVLPPPQQRLRPGRCAGPLPRHPGGCAGRLGQRRGAGNRRGGGDAARAGAVAGHAGARAGRVERGPARVCPGARGTGEDGRTPSPAVQPSGPADLRRIQR